VVQTRPVMLSSYCFVCYSCYELVTALSVDRFLAILNSSGDCICDACPLRYWLLYLSRFHTFNGVTFAALYQCVARGSFYSTWLGISAKVRCINELGDTITRVQIQRPHWIAWILAIEESIFGWQLLFICESAHRG